MALHVPILPFDSNGFSEDAVGTDPAVEVASIVTDLEAAVVDRLDEVEVIATVDFDEDDVAGLQQGHVAGRNGDEVTVVYFAAHGVSARANLDGLAFFESFDCEFCPTHDPS
jgi:hypothetical protein